MKVGIGVWRNLRWKQLYQTQNCSSTLTIILVPFKENTKDEYYVKQYNVMTFQGKESSRENKAIYIYIYHIHTKYK